MLGIEFLQFDYAHIENIPHETKVFLAIRPKDQGI